VGKVCAVGGEGNGWTETRFRFFEEHWLYGEHHWLM